MTMAANQEWIPLLFVRCYPECYWRPQAGFRRLFQCAFRLRSVRREQDPPPSGKQYSAALD